MTKSLKDGIRPTYAPISSPTFLHRMTKNEQTPSSGNTPRELPDSIFSPKTQNIYFYSKFIGGTKLEESPLRMVR